MAAPSLQEEDSGEDLVQLRQIALFHHILAGVTLFLAFLPISRFMLGLAMMRGETTIPALHMFPQEELGWLLVVLAGGIILLGWIHACILFLMGRWITTRKHHVALLVISGMNCFYFPIGTAVSIWAIMVLSRPRVAVMFGRTA